MSRLSVLNKFKTTFLNHLRFQINHNQRKFHHVSRTSFDLNFARTLTSQLRLSETEQEFLVRIKDDPDIFGAPTQEQSEIDADDLKEEKFLENPPSAEQKLRTKQYADIIKDLIRKKKIKEAIDVLEERMIKQDRVKPENYIFNLILGACGRVGYTKKAFSLYNKMKQRGLKVTGGTYTALFNACANSPWSEDGLTRAKHLREIMIEKSYEANETNYNAMIKAFGRCGDLKTAFALADEMHSKKIYIKSETINFLLQACISDTEAGFRHSILVWRKFINKGIAPNIYSYNLLLKCCKECGMGDAAVTEDVIGQILSGDKMKMLEPGENNQLTSAEIVENRPNLIAKVPHLGNVLSLNEVKKTEDRLLLIGGCHGFLQNMLENHCSPDVKTFTQLIECIPSTLAAEKELIIAMKKFNVKPDVDFFNILIKKRSMRCDYVSAQEVLAMIKGAGLKPDLITYGVLALGCKTREEAQELMARMNEAQYRMNPEILGAMLHQACYHNSFPYVIELMETCLKEEIRPNKKFMEHLEEFKKKCKKISNDVENDLSKSKSFQKGYTVFKMRYNTWKDEVQPIDDDETHPWQQFRQETKTDVRHYKDKEATSRFKPKHTSLYRQKKVDIVNKKHKKKVQEKDDKNLIENYEAQHQINAT